MQPRGVIRSVPEDFVVEEIPSYLPSGEGEHLYVLFEKIGRTTDDVVREMARRLGIRPDGVGVAGMKDRHARTIQRISLPVPPRTEGFDEKVLGLDLPNVRILDATRHGNKLKTGHLRGNRFRLRIRKVPTGAIADARARFEKLAREGVPNAYGTQRFGREGDNAEYALKFLRGETEGPRDPKKRRFLFSALQSSIFNRVLQARIADGTWNTALAGDLLSRERKVLAGEDDDTRGALFLCEDPVADAARALEGEVSPTGPIPGVSMKRPGGAVATLEDSITQEVVGGNFDWARAKSLGEGTRRPLRLWIEDLEIPAKAEPLTDNEGATQLQTEEADMQVAFVLPKGAYATTVLAAVFELSDGHGEEPDDDRNRSTETPRKSEGI